MVMHTLNCTYGGGINHDAKCCCSFVGRISGEGKKVQTVFMRSSHAELSGLLPELIKLESGIGRRSIFS